MVDTEFCPWEQLPDEPGDEWAAFVVYRDLGPTRSLMEASRVARCGKNSAVRWNKAFDWQARVRAWDAEVDRHRRQRFLTEQRRIIRLHADAAKSIREKAMEAMTLITADMLALDPDKALKWVKFATELESKACGLPTEVTALSLSGGQARPTEDIYFESLPDEKLVNIVQLSIDTLRKDKGVAHDGRDNGGNASNGEDKERAQRALADRV